MAETITRYKVFIASPAGLEDERKVFRDTIRDYNEEIDEMRRDVSFMPMGWENTLSGVGRPQSLINKDIVTCDYFMLLLWDRWGSTPGQAHLTYPAKTCKR